MSDTLLEVERPSLRKGTVFRARDSVRVHVKVREGEKERQVSLAGHRAAGGGLRDTFAVRKISSGLESSGSFWMPVIDRIEVERKGAVRSQARLSAPGKGKAARIDEKLYDEKRTE